MERGFLDSGGRKSNHREKMDTVTGIGSASKSIENICDTSEPDGTPSGVDMDVTTSAGNTPSKSSYDNVTGKLRFLDDDENPLVPTGIVESDSEVEMVFNETANLRISASSKDRSDKGYSTNSLLEQWRDFYPDNDDYDPYDDDMYHDMSKHLQSICDDLDITVRGVWLHLKKKMDKKGLSNSWDDLVDQLFTGELVDDKTLLKIITDNIKLQLIGLKVKRFTNVQKEELPLCREIGLGGQCMMGGIGSGER
nr:hypothetical protein [Tanacetum cinerariifolium]